MGELVRSNELTDIEEILVLNENSREFSIRLRIEFQFHSLPAMKLVQVIIYIHIYVHIFLLKRKYSDNKKHLKYVLTEQTLKYLCTHNCTSVITSSWPNLVSSLPLYFLLLVLFGSKSKTQYEFISISVYSSLRDKISLKKTNCNVFLTKFKIL